MKPIKGIGVFVAGTLAVFYLLNPTAGIFELLPDNLPFIGNIDEAAAVMVLLAAFRYFGIDLTRFFNKGRDVTPKK